MRFLSIDEPSLCDGESREEKPASLRTLNFCRAEVKTLIILFLLFIPFFLQASSCININTAPREELKQIKHIGESRAEQILKIRQEKLFSSLDELENVKGIGSARVADIKTQGLACVKNSEPAQEAIPQKIFKENLAQAKPNSFNPLLLLFIGLIVAIFSGFVILLLSFFMKKKGGDKHSLPFEK